MKSSPVIELFKRKKLFTFFFLMFPKLYSIGINLTLFLKYFSKLFSVNNFGLKPIFLLSILEISLGQNLGISKISKFFPDCCFA